MGKFYNTNAVYKYLEDNRVSGFEFAKGSLWLLLYGNSKCEPKILLAASASSPCNYEKHVVTEHEKRIFDIGQKMAEKAGLPFVVIRFRSDADKLDVVEFIDWKRKKRADMHIDKLGDIFVKHGLSTKKGSASKAVNDKTSSAFHNWQRSTLGNEIIATDLDLLRVGENGDPTEIYELKRAEVPSFDEWKPFPKDYANFRLVSNFSRLAGLDFYILFNRRETRPFKDDISRLKLFTFNNNEAKLIKILTMDEFIGGVK